MNKTWLVLKHEFLTVVARKSFILMLVLLPLGGFIVMMVVSGLQKSTGNQDVVSDFFTPQVEQTVEGYVDLSGIIQTVPEEDASLLTAFSSEEEARQAMNDGEISAIYIVQADYLKSGDITYIRPDFNPIGGSQYSGVIVDVLNYNLTGKNQALAYRINNPMNVEEENTSPQATRDYGDENMMNFFVPYFVTLLFYVVILGSASLMLSNLTNEKQNRTIEIVMTSVTPVQMLTGKIIALGLAGLLQTVVWGGCGYLLMRLGGQTFNVASLLQVPVSVLIWGIVFFILGYTLYAALMAGVGALVPNMREASQATTVLILPMIIPLMLLSVLIETPNSPLSIFLGLFPLTAPVAMITRLVAAPLDLWQPILASVLLIAFSYLVIRAVANMFRAQNLLSGKEFSLKVFFRALFGKAV